LYCIQNNNIVYVFTFQGVYVVQDLDTDVLMGINFPESFFYVTKNEQLMRFTFTKNNEVNGCQIFVVEIKRPWENNS